MPLSQWAPRLDAAPASFPPSHSEEHVELFFQQLLNGLTIGGVYSLVALGLTLVYGILHVPNFAHGAFYMTGAFIALKLMGGWGVNYWLAMVGAAIVVALIAAASE